KAHRSTNSWGRAPKKNSNLRRLPRAMANVALRDDKEESRQSTDSDGSEPFLRPGGAFAATICLSKAAIGAGVLSIAAHCGEVGAGFQAMSLVTGAWLTVWSIDMIARVCIETGRWSFEDLCELVHPAFAALTGFINASMCVGCAAAYLMVAGQVYQVLLDADDKARARFVVFVGVFLCGPLALARHVSFMRHLAACSMVALLFLVVSVAWFAGTRGVAESVTKENFLEGVENATVFTRVNSLNTVVFAYTNQFNAPQLLGEISEPKELNMAAAARWSSLLSLVLYSMASVLGVLAFGVNQKDTLVLGLSPARTEAYVQLCLLAVMFSSLMCFQFHVYPVRQFVAYLVRKLRGRKATQEKDVMYLGQSLTRWLDILCALTTVVLAILVAVVMTSLRSVLNFIGAFASSYISYIVPPVCLLALRGQKDFWSAEMAPVVLFAVGAFFFIFGTYAAVVS
ncbi:unnamed protein product, partial [Effrenium voratum]